MSKPRLAGQVTQLAVVDDKLLALIDVLIDVLSDVLSDVYPNNLL